MSGDTFFLVNGGELYGGISLKITGILVTLKGPHTDVRRSEAESPVNFTN